MAPFSPSTSRRALVAAGALALAAGYPAEEDAVLEDEVRVVATSVDETYLPSDLQWSFDGTHLTGSLIATTVGSELKDLIDDTEKVTSALAVLPVDPEDDALVEGFMAELHREGRTRPITRRAVVD
jgi:hypothetical protein